MMKKPVERGVLKTPPEEEMALVSTQGHADRVQELLDFGVDANHYGEERSYLYLAALHGHSMVMGKLIRAGAHVQRTHLTAALRGGNPYCVEKIMDEFFFAGTDIDLHHVAHHLFVSRGEACKSNPKLFRWLAAQGFDFSEPDRLGRTVLEVARIDGAPPDVLEVLEELTGES